MADRLLQARQALAEAAAQLCADAPASQAAAEAAYMAQLSAFCELHLQGDPAGLAAALNDAPIVPLQVAAHRQLLHYYQGLAAGLAERYPEALATLDRLLAEADLDDAVRGRALNSAAIFARLGGDYQRALLGYQASAALWQRLGNQARHGLALYNLAILHYELHAYSEAEQGMAAAIQLFMAVDDQHRIALAHHELALICRDQGRWAEALAYATEAEAQFRQEGATDYLGRVANNIGELELLQGRFAAAEARFAEALQRMTTRVYAVDAWLNQGLVHQALGDDGAALEDYRAALQLAEQIERHDIVPLLHGRLAHAARRLGRHDEANASAAAALAATEARRKPLRDEGLLIGLMGRWQGLYEEALLHMLDQGDLRTAFDISERARARAFADLLARRGSGHPDSEAAPLDSAAVQQALPPGVLLLAYVATGLRSAEQPLLDAMPPEAAPLRECLVVAPRLVLFAITSERLEAHFCPLDPNLFNARSPFLADGQRFLRPAILRRAYDALIAPVADQVASASQVLVVPHGPLHQIPFAALLDPHNRPLLDLAPRLSYGPSATVLLGTPARPAQAGRQPLLALSYDGGATAHLRHTAAEAEAVAALCNGLYRPGRPGMLGELTTTAGIFRWLHIACHGQFLVDNPLESWLEVGPHERLSAATVLRDLRLDADLVVLSACQSGVSQILRGDEPLGLVRAFLLAGARAVLVTLWPVEDASARLLMEHFYRILLANAHSADAAAALRMAQQQLREHQLTDGSTPYAEPTFWAAYTLVARAGAPHLAIGAEPLTADYADKRGF
jgi:tetratricopeptide (TPR) repeat protein